MSILGGLEPTFEMGLKLGVQEESYVIRPVDLEKDYDTIQAWYQGYNDTPPAKESLSPNGLMVEGVCAIWILSTDTEIAFLEPLVSNPTADKALKNKAIDALIERAIDLCKEMQKTKVFVISKIQQVADRRERHGFKLVTDHNYFLFRSLA